MKSAAPILLLSWLLFAAAHTQSYAQQNPQPTLQPPQTGYGKGLGRLLTTESERSKLDDLRFNGKPIVPPPKTTDAGPPQLHIDGISQRPDMPIGQRTTVWLDGRAYLENALPRGLSLVRNSSGEVIGMNSAIGRGKREFAKIGDAITRPQTLEEAKAQALANQLAQTRDEGKK